MFLDGKTLDFLRPFATARAQPRVADEGSSCPQPRIRNEQFPRLDNSGNFRRAAIVSARVGHARKNCPYRRANAQQPANVNTPPDFEAGKAKLNPLFIAECGVGATHLSGFKAHIASKERSF